MDYIWNVTGRCNLKCEYCWDIFKKESEIDTIGAKKIIDNITKSDCNMVLFTGGEPLVRKDLFELIEYCKSKDVKYIKICSNGTLIKDRIEEIKSSSISEIHISLDTYNETLNSYRSQNKKVIENIECLINSVDTSNLKIVLVSVIDYNNLDEFENVLKYAKEKGIYVSYQLPVVDKSNDLGLSIANFNKNSFEALFERLNKIHKEYKGQIDYFCNYYYLTAKDYYINNTLPKSCMAGKDFKIISPKGKFYSCYSCKERTKNIEECFDDKCLVWFRSGKKALNILKLLNKE